MTLPNKDNLIHLGLAPALTLELEKQVASLEALEAVTALNTVGAGTITGAGIAGCVTNRGGAQGGSAFTDTTDTAANIIAAQSNTFTNLAWEYTYENQTNAVATLAGGTGVTLAMGAGALAVGPGEFARFLVVITGAATVSMTLIASGSIDTMPLLQRTSISSGNGTLTGAQVAGAKIVTLMTSGATAQTTPTAAAMLAAMPGAVIGTQWRLRIYNTNGGTLTITADASVTLTGTATIATTIWREYDMQILTATTASMQNVGAGNAT